MATSNVPTSPTFRIENGVLHIAIPMQEPTESASGKTLVVATTHGNMPTTAQVNGKAIIVGINAYIRK